MPIAYYVTPPLSASMQESSDTPVAQRWPSSGSCSYTAFTPLSGAPIPVNGLQQGCAVAVASYSIGYSDDTYLADVQSMCLKAWGQVASDGSGVDLYWEYQVQGDNDKPTTATCVFVILVIYGESSTPQGQESLLATLTPTVVNGLYPGYATTQPAFATTTPSTLIPLLSGFNVTFSEDDGQLNNTELWLSVASGSGGVITAMGSLSMYGGDYQNGQGSVDVAILSTLSTTPASSTSIQSAALDIILDANGNGSGSAAFSGPVVRSFGGIQGFYYSYEGTILSGQTHINRTIASVSTAADAAHANLVDVTVAGGAFREEGECMSNQTLRVVVVALVKNPGGAS